ncbi:MAG TPA: ribosome assembly factor SBDS [Candidatus Nanoarchaeia archaeon]|nr:ribosome assembly factor SBDS [Candidatus Nanoarchaeia archaeon]
MTNVVARIKQHGKNFEILVDVDKALEYKKGLVSNIGEVIAIDKIFYDSKKGLHASEKDLTEAFGTDDVNSISDKIVKSGEIQVPLEYKEKQRGEKEKQIVDFLVRNSVDPRTDRPYTPDRIERSMDEAGVSISNKPIEAQMNEIVSKLKVVLPIKIQTKRIKITVPAQYTGQAYGYLQNYKESEEWKGNGELTCVVNVPVGFQMEFYDKLNMMTHGSVISEELKEK